MVTRDEVKRANARAVRLRDAGPTAVSASYDRRSGRVVVRLSSGIDVGFSPRDTQGLETAKPAQLDPIEINPSGLGLHFPKLDADLYLPALLDGVLGSRRWMAARLGERGGRARSPAKSAASRKNGKFGGRPRKVAPG
ncbi:MAG TPA: DUF2442 domain-containing protein [Xanthobacteraceae bacterium]|jgi:hypothetical protein|nr:DUF2442 domain-containing protein [Xanthobacteraceae bacterium]